MTTLIAKVRNGRIDLPPMPEFTEGSDVSVTLRPVEESLGITRDEDPFSIDNWLAGAGFDEPPLISEAESQQMRQMRKADRELEAAKMKLLQEHMENDP